MTLSDLKEQLAIRFDEVDILDMLGVDSYQLVEAFSDLILDRFEELESELMEEYSEG